MEFSLVLCVYAKENPTYLSQCLESIAKQTVLPDEVIIVKDGSLIEELEMVLDNFNFPKSVKIIALPQNMTLGPARARGVEVAQYEWIALMDSDDICLPNRFETQLALISLDKNIDIIGGQITEYDDIPGDAISIRSVPVTHEAILTRAKKRNPFNAMTVIFKREKAIQAGNFRYFPGFEDYDLWVRMIKNGAVCANCPEILVHARIGNGLYNRRSGFGYICSEWKMQRNLRKLRITTGLEFIRNILTRIPMRLLPQRCLKGLYAWFGGRVAVEQKTKCLRVQND